MTVNETWEVNLPQGKNSFLLIIHTAQHGAVAFYFPWLDSRGITKSRETFPN